MRESLLDSLSPAPEAFIEEDEFLPPDRSQIRSRLLELGFKVNYGLRLLCLPNKFDIVDLSQWPV